MKKPKGLFVSSSVFTEFLSNRLLYLVVFTLIVLVLLALTVSNRTLCIIKCDNKYSLYSGFTSDPESILDNEGISLGSYDEIITEDGKILTKIEVIRAYPVNISADGETTTLYTTGDTVTELLDKLNIVLGPYDGVSPKSDTVVQNGGTVAVSRGTVEYVEEEVTVPYETVTVESDEYYEGTEINKSDGENGTATAKYALIYRDGELISKELISEKVTTESVSAYRIVGTRSAAQTSAVLTSSSTLSSSGSSGSSSSGSHSGSSGSSSTGSGSSGSTSGSSGSGSSGIGGSYGTITVNANSDGTGTVTTVSGKTYKYKAVYQCTATAYAATGNRTATGTVPKWGTVAVDKTLIPLYSKLFICNKYYSWQYAEKATAEDVGGGIKEYRVDLFMNSETQCFTYGRRTVWVFVLAS